MADTQKNLVQGIKSHLERAITEEAERIFDKAKERAAENFERSKNQVISSLVIALMQKTSFNFSGGELIITVDTKHINDDGSVESRL